MLRRIIISIVVAVAVVLAVQVLMRNGSPQSLVTPPKMELPALDRRPEP
jgi:hypothetical protein